MGHAVPAFRRGPFARVEPLEARQLMSTVPNDPDYNVEQQRQCEAEKNDYAAVVKRAPHRATFDRLFDLWWPPAIGDGEAARSEGQGEGADGELTEIDPADLDAMKQMLRDQLRDVLLKGDDEALRRLARASVNGLGRTDSQPGRQSWFTYRVLRALSPETLMADLLKAVMEGQEQGGLAEKVARQMLTERIKKFEEYVEAEVRRRLAEDRGVEQIQKTAVKPLIEQVDFLRASRDEIAELRRRVYPLARRLAGSRRACSRSGPRRNRRALPVRGSTRTCPTSARATTRPCARRASRD